MAETKILSPLSPDSYKDRETHREISWGNFLKIALDLGFEPARRVKFMGRCLEEEIILIHESKGLVLFATSHWTNNVAVAKVYGELKLNEDFPYTIFSSIQYHKISDNMNLLFEIDALNGLVWKLSRLSNAGEFQSQWHENHHLYFLNYVEEKEVYTEYEQVTKAKILESPDVARIIYGI